MQNKLTQYFSCFQESLTLLAIVLQLGYESLSRDVGHDSPERHALHPCTKYRTAILLLISQSVIGLFLLRKAAREQTANKIVKLYSRQMQMQILSVDSPSIMHTQNTWP